VIDRSAPDVLQQVMDATDHRGATFVLELVGRATLQSSISMLADYGRIVCVGTLSGDLAQINVMDLIMKRGTIKGSFAEVRQEDYETILRLFADGTFQPVIDSVLPLREARAARERIERYDVRLSRDSPRKLTEGYPRLTCPATTRTQTTPLSGGQPGFSRNPLQR